MPDFNYGPTYQRSHALIVGIDRYTGQLPPLMTADDGARAVAQLLRDDFGFDSVTLLLNEEATQRNIRRALTDPLSRREKVGPDDRVIIYFAGHGLTYDTVYGEVGYIAPVDGDPEYEDTLIAMDELTRTASNRIHAKHVLFLLDACFSGFATTRMTGAVERQYRDFITRRARQVITAGTREQAASDEWGPDGHSLFTGFLLDGLRGAAPMPGGMLRAFHVAGYVQDQVAQHSRSQQTPQYAPLLGSQGGDFIFDVRQVSDLPEWVRAAADSDDTSQRLVAVSQLRDLLRKASAGESSGLAIAKLEEMADNDPDSLVRNAAQTALEGMGTGAQVAPQIREEPVDTSVDLPIPEEIRQMDAAAPQPQPTPGTAPPRLTGSIPPLAILAGIGGGVLVVGLILLVVALSGGAAGDNATPPSAADKTPTEPIDPTQAEGPLEATAQTSEDQSVLIDPTLGQSTNPLSFEMIYLGDDFFTQVAEEVGLSISQFSGDTTLTKVEHFCEGVTQAGFYSAASVLTMEEKGCNPTVIGLINSGGLSSYTVEIVATGQAAEDISTDVVNATRYTYCVYSYNSFVNWKVPELWFESQGIPNESLTVAETNDFDATIAAFATGECDISGFTSSTEISGTQAIATIGPIPNVLLVVGPQVSSDLKGDIRALVEEYLLFGNAAYVDTYGWQSLEPTSEDELGPLRTLLGDAGISAESLLE